MSERLQQLNVEFNKNYDIRLMYDQCKTGTSQYGPWYLYSVEVNNESLGLFADPALHNILKNYRKGDNLTIRRNKSDSGVNWDVKRITNGNGSAPATVSTPLFDDRTRDIHRQVALKIATQSMGPTTKPWTEYEKSEIQSRVNALLEILEGECDDDLPF